MINSSQQKNRAFLFLFFLIWPFGAFLYSLYNYDKKYLHVFLILFTGIYGYGMIATNQELDLYRYLQSASEYARIPTTGFFKMLTGGYVTNSLGQTGGTDFYRDIVTFIISRFSNAGSVLMMTFGLVYGYLYVKCINYFLAINERKCIYSIVILLCFSTAIGLSTFAGVRYATAAMYFFFVSCFALRRKSILAWVLVCCSILIHFSFIPAVLLLFILKSATYRV